MNVALKIQQSIGDKTDLKTIKKVISLYEKLKEDDEDFVSADEAISSVNQLLGEVTVQEKIKAFRSREKFSQKKLAEISGIPQQHISEIERGVRPVGLTIAKKLALALNCDYRSLL